GGPSNLIEGDFIGIAADGTTQAGNNQDGVVISINGFNALAADNTITGSIISGNESVGVEVDYGVPGTVISGNRIGTDAAGANAVPNTFGIFLLGSGATTIGGTGAGTGNLISGNQNDGIVVDLTTSAILITGNLVGTDATGTSAIPNG